MKCDICKNNEAVMHIKSVINGKTKEYHLCPSCAAQNGYDDFSNTALSQMLSSFFEGNMIAGEKHCKTCNTRLSEIAKTGKVGCSDCYETFYEELIPYIKRIQNSPLHNGKRLDVKDNNVNSLKDELRRLIAEERFEEAAVLRDKIKEAEGKEL